jgi:xylulose-5-phosphate/fructose-6-phosphate phosphoketolase
MPGHRARTAAGSREAVFGSGVIERSGHDNIHVRGYKEEGTTTTPFDMVVLNNLDRYQLALDAIRRIPRLRDQVENATARYWTTMERHKLYISEHGDDMPEVRDWRWNL